MRIVLLTQSLNYGGTERQLVTLAKGLHDRQVSILVAVFYSGGPLETELRDAGVPVRGLGKRGRWDVVGFLLRLLRLLRREQPDILYSHLGVPNLLTAILKPLFVRIKMVWGVRASDMDLTRYDWLARITFRFECLLARSADLIIVNSKVGRDYHLAQGFPEGKMVVIPNGIDTQCFCPDPGARRRIRAEWGITESDKLIGLVGRLDPMKDHPTFLKAAALLTREHDNVRFVCVGDGPEGYRQELRRLAREWLLADRLIWAGERSDIKDVYSALDLACLSSSYGEGFPNVVGEAMACGVPCVVTDVGDAAWTVADTGIIVPRQNPQALAEGCRVMLDRLSDGQRSLGEKARARIVSHFNHNALVQNTCDILVSVL